MKNLFKKVTTALLVVFVATSCDVTDQTPQQSLPADNVLTSESGVRSTLAGAYNSYQGAITADYIFTELAADYAGHSGSYPSWGAVDEHNLLPSNAEARDMWIDYYDMINITNNIIFALSDESDNSYAESFTADEQSAIVAEAKALRALAYHSLVRWFGGVPLVTQPTENFESGINVPRSSVSEVYNQIATDLGEAETALAALGNTNFPNAERINLNTVKALLARVHLYQGNYTLAEDYATEVIDSGVYNLGLFQNLYGATPSSQETIFLISFTSEDSNSLSFFARPNGGGGRNEYSPTSAFVNAFADEDTRINSALMGIGGNSQRVNGTSYLGKYFTLTGEDDVIVIRLAEMYLIRAEARGLKPSPDYAGVASDLNQIQRRAYEEQNVDGTYPATDYSATDFTSEDDVVTEVLYHRGLELSQEGHRWHDYNRLGLTTSELGVDADMTLWPIPQRDMETNPELEQNPGY